MTEKDINIEDEETLEEAPVEEAAVESEEAKAEEPAEEKDPLEKAQAEIEELKTQLLYKAAEFDNYRKRTARRSSLPSCLSLTIWSAPSRTVRKPMIPRCSVRV